MYQAWRLLQYEISSTVPLIKKVFHSFVQLHARCQFAAVGEAYQQGEVVCADFNGFAIEVDRIVVKQHQALQVETDAILDNTLAELGIRSSSRARGMKLN